MVLNSFLSYLLLFAILVLLAVAGALLGVRLRKHKDAKDQNDTGETASENEIRE